MKAPPLHIAVFRAAGREEWEEACRACDYATFFHTPYWVDLFVPAAGGRIVSAAEVITFNDGVSAILPLPYSQYVGGVLRIYWSMPACTFGGWVSADNLTSEHAGILSARLCSRRDLIWRENPYDPFGRSLPMPGAEHDFTQAIDLRNGFEAAAADFDHAHRKAVRRARAAGVVVTEAMAFDQWERYFQLYESSRERWKEKHLTEGRGYPFALFKAAFNLPAPLRKLWLAEINGRPASGILCFYWNRHAVAWNGAGDADLFMNRPNNLLYEQAMRYAAGEGYRWFDCNPSAGLSGVFAFKEHLGAAKLQSRLLNKRSTLRRAMEWGRGLLQ